MSNGKLAVIIPSKRANTVYATLDSVLAQEGFEQILPIAVGESCTNAEFRARIASDYPQVILGSKDVAGPILPGAARNMGLDLLAAREDFGGSDWVLMIDDDVVIKSDHARTLAELIASDSGLVSAMGRMETRPITFAGRVIDYSNFWWQQLSKDNLDFGWLGGAQVLTRFGDIGDTRFNPDLAVGEDSDFFARIKQKTEKRFAICSAVTSHHYHGRNSLAALIKYQFTNGQRHPDSKAFGKFGIWPRFKRWYSQSKTAISANRRQLVSKPHIILGVMFSFWLFELGSLVKVWRG